MRTRGMTLMDKMKTASGTGSSDEGLTENSFPDDYIPHIKPEPADDAEETQVEDIDVDDPLALLPGDHFEEVNSIKTEQTDTRIQPDLKIEVHENDLDLADVPTSVPDGDHRNYQFTGQAMVDTDKKLKNEYVGKDGKYCWYQCAHSSTNTSDLKGHHNTHTGERPFPCDKCNKAFTRQSSLTKHMRFVHNKLKPHSCDICGKRFSYSGHITIHKRRHTGERPFACDKCGKAFPQKRDLTGHIRAVHAKLKPHSCDICGKRFSHSGNLNIHKRIHTGERPFPCDKCSMTFGVQSSLTRHIQIVHEKLKPHSCDVCGKTFSQSSSITKHKRLHTGERPFACDKCGKAFPQKRDLTRHIRAVHAKLKPHSCDICGKRFSESGNLTRHQRIHFHIVDTSAFT